MLRQQAFTGQTPLLKGALHCHTTRSDGQETPPEIIRLHRERGYDFLSVTDHRLYNYQNFSPDTEITIIPGMEMDYRLPLPGISHYHFVCVGPPAGGGNGYKQDQTMQSEPIVNGQADVQAALDEIHANGNLTIHCHPEWSGIPSRGFDQLAGNFAMEIWNSGCVVEHDLDSNAAYWDELLMMGKRIYGVATDDGHQMSHHFIGYVKVNARNTVPDILRALKSGAFYASCGPVIHDFYVDNGVAVLACSPAFYAGFRYGGLPSRLTFADKEPVTRAETKVPSFFSYIRGIVKDENGRMAWTNPIFLNSPD